MIHVIAEITVGDGKRSEFLEQFRRLTSRVREEEGCIEYGSAIYLETEIRGQPAVRDNVVTVVEKWESLAALEAHLQAPHMEEFRADVQDLVKGIEIRVLDPA